MQAAGKSGWPRSGPLQETIPTSVNKTGSWRFLTPVLRENNSPCRLACPLESGVPHWMNKVREGDWQAAWQILQEYNPFPALTGHLCYRFCEEKCHRARWDEAVAIREVEKAIGLWRQRHYNPGVQNPPGRGRGLDKKKVAIIGSGPAGLSCAYYLRQQGAAITVLEKMPMAGGLLATGVPAYRLPRNILEKELAILKAEGIAIQTGREVGRDISLPELQGQFDAVLLAVGAQESRRLQIPGEDLPGVTGALEYLQDLHLSRQEKVARRVVVVGGGNAAVDAACMAKLQGAAEVHLLYRRAREEMPAHADEVRAAAAAGVNFVFAAVLQEIVGKEKVQKVRVLRVVPTHRGESLQVIPGTAFDLACDLLIIAIGQESSLPALVPSWQDPGFQEKGGRLVRVCLNEEKRLFAAGDALTGPTNVAAAIFEGRRAALQLLQALGGQPEVSPGPQPIVHQKKAATVPGMATPLQGPQAAVDYGRLNPCLYPRQGRLAAPREEAGRCFSCGTCSRCGVCWAFCPEPAVEIAADACKILLDYCKGCGICAQECPAGVLVMEEVF